MWILLLLLESLVSAHQDSGWQLPRPTSSRAYLHLPYSASWTQAEDRCQQLYGHLARDDSAGELREFMKQEKIGGQVWIGLHQWAPADAFHWVDDFSWTDVDIPSSSIWGEYVEEYEMALCVSLDIDYGYRWDTRYCQGEEIAGSICQIEVPTWIHQENCNTSRLLHLWIKNHTNFNIKYFPDNETLEAECLCGETLRKSTICSIDERFQEVFPLCCDDDEKTVGTESTVSTEFSSPSSTHQEYSTEKSGPTTKLPVSAITQRQEKEKQTENLQIAEITTSQPEKYSSTSSPPENSTTENIVIEPSSTTNQDVINKTSLTSKQLNVSTSTTTATSENMVETSTTLTKINTTTVEGSTSPTPTSPTTISGPTETSTQTLQRPKRQSQWLSTRVRRPKGKPARFRKSYQGRVSNRQSGRD